MDIEYDASIRSSPRADVACEQSKTAQAEGVQQCHNTVKSLCQLAKECIERQLEEIDNAKQKAEETRMAQQVNDAHEVHQTINVHDEQDTDEARYVSEVCELEEVRVIQKVHEVEKVDEVDETSQIHRAREIEKMDEVGEVHEVHRVHEIRKAHEIDEVHEVHKPNESDGDDEVDEVREVHEVHKVHEVHEIHEIDEDDEVAGVHEVHEAHKVHEIDEVGEVNEVQEVHEKDEVAEVEKVHEIHEVHETNDVVEFAEVNEVDKDDKIHEIPEVHQVDVIHDDSPMPIEVDEREQLHTPKSLKDLSEEAIVRSNLVRPSLSSCAEVPSLRNLCESVILESGGQLPVLCFVTEVTDAESTLWQADSGDKDGSEIYLCLNEDLIEEELAKIVGESVVESPQSPVPEVVAEVIPVEADGIMTGGLMASNVSTAAEAPRIAVLETKSIPSPVAAVVVRVPEIPADEYESDDGSSTSRLCLVTEDIQSNIQYEETVPQTHSGDHFMVKIEPFKKYLQNKYVQTSNYFKMLIVHRLLKKYIIYQRHSVSKRAKRTATVAAIIARRKPKPEKKKKKPKRRSCVSRTRRRSKPTKKPVKNQPKMENATVKPIKIRILKSSESVPIEAEICPNETQSVRNHVSKKSSKSSPARDVSATSTRDTPKPTKTTKASFDRTVSTTSPVTTTSSTTPTPIITKLTAMPVVSSAKSKRLSPRRRFSIATSTVSSNVLPPILPLRVKRFSPPASTLRTSSIQTRSHSSATFATMPASPSAPKTKASSVPWPALKTMDVPKFSVSHYNSPADALNNVTVTSPSMAWKTKVSKATSTPTAKPPKISPSNVTSSVASSLPLLKTRRSSWAIPDIPKPSPLSRSSKPGINDSTAPTYLANSLEPNKSLRTSSAPAAKRQRMSPPCITSSSVATATSAPTTAKVTSTQSHKSALPSVTKVTGVPEPARRSSISQPASDTPIVTAPSSASWSIPPLRITRKLTPFRRSSTAAPTAPSPSRKPSPISASIVSFVTDQIEKKIAESKETKETNILNDKTIDTNKNLVNYAIGPSTASANDNVRWFGGNRTNHSDHADNNNIHSNTKPTTITCDILERIAKKRIIKRRLSTIDGYRHSSDNYNYDTDDDISDMLSSYINHGIEQRSLPPVSTPAATPRSPSPLADTPRSPSPPSRSTFERAREKLSKSIAAKYECATKGANAFRQPSTPTITTSTTNIRARPKTPPTPTAAPTVSSYEWKQMKLDATRSTGMPASRTKARAKSTITRHSSQEKQVREVCREANRYQRNILQKIAKLNFGEILLNINDFYKKLPRQERKRSTSSSSSSSTSSSSKAKKHSTKRHRTYSSSSESTSSTSSSDSASSSSSNSSKSKSGSSTWSNAHHRASVQKCVQRPTIVTRSQLRKPIVGMEEMTRQARLCRAYSENIRRNLNLPLEMPDCVMDRYMSHNSNMSVTNKRSEHQYEPFVKLYRDRFIDDLAMKYEQNQPATKNTTKVNRKRKLHT